ncbi:hypothetical protein [Pontibacter anaerobius]|uniref:Uncharacterized protein n=1 Tax=Pontibacter anaerobius TaxID=2993940 RepID=A0ABT3RBP1_9BACT|nr:hypothetical protein [Pontibacter anaerobius]MCX2739283.1 hypothetical protein [Pontibacter anaerobius]
MMKKLFAMAILCVWFTGALAQEQVKEEDKLSRLMSEREQLILEYQYFKQQNSSFWGTQSKKDLLNIIETLKKIINLDTELVAAVKENSIRQYAQSTVESKRQGKLTIEDQRNFEKQVSSLQGEVKTLESTLRKKDREMAELQSQVQASYDVKYGKDKVISVLAVGAFILLLYAVFLHVRLSKAKSKPGKRKKA